MNSCSLDVSNWVVTLLGVDNVSGARILPHSQRGQSSPSLWPECVADNCAHPAILPHALKLPHRITMSRARATSAGEIRRRYYCVPKVGPKERAQPRHTQRWHPSLWPLSAVCFSPQRRHGKLSGDGLQAMVHLLPLL